MILQVVGSYGYCCVDSHAVPIDVWQVQVFFVVVACSYWEWTYCYTSYGFATCACVTPWSSSWCCACTYDFIILASYHSYTCACAPCYEKILVRMPNDKRKSKGKTTIPDKPTKFANQLDLENQFD